jgi:O-antigen/teichoic acid export membrane protein
MATSQHHLIHNRFSASLIGNILRSGVSFATVLLLARWLGPEDYGRMAFLLASFMAFKQLLDMASSSAFFTFLSQRKRSRKFINYYWRWICFQLIFSLLLIGLLLPDSILNSVWQGEPRMLVVLALLAAFMQHNVWSIASQMAEAQRETVRVQLLNVVITILHLAVVVALWFGGKLLLPLLFIAMAIEWSIAGWLASTLYHRHDEHVTSLEDEQDTAVSIFNEFWGYCKLFIPYSWLGFVHDFGSRWMLQNWGGASEQAYYAIAQQFAGISLLATTSILGIFWKEIAEAHYQRDDEKVKRLYLKVSRALYFIGALAAGMLLPWAGEIIMLLLGAAYSDGIYTLMIMLLYPIYQSLGQVGGTLLYATGHTRFRAISGIVIMVVGITVVYFMLAPNDSFIPGFGLASQGMAIKMVVMQLFTVNIISWFIARIFKWEFDWFYQPVSLGMAILAGFVAKLMITSVISEHVIVLMFGSALIYLLLMGYVLYIMPWLVGLDRIELNIYLAKARKIIRLIINNVYKIF